MESPGAKLDGSEMGTVYLIERAAESQPFTITETKISLSAVPEIEGKPNVGFSYGSGPPLPAPVSIARGHFDAHGSVTPHRTRNVYIVYVVRGSGELDLFSDHGGPSKIAFRAGDVVVLPPATMHRWTNGAGEFDFIGIECVKPEQ